VVWWVTEAIPIAATALLPLAVLPLSGAVSVKDAAAPYADPIIFLFIGGFMLAAAVEHWRLHERIALSIASFAGGRPIPLVGCFMLASAVISMWISNTATTLMLAPIALGAARALSPDGKPNLALGGALLLGGHQSGRRPISSRSVSLNALENPWRSPIGCERPFRSS
jgi:solute carrier family 13 (sodium-dependent dicarboxylate transporter), member 2/3/5